MSASSSRDFATRGLVFRAAVERFGQGAKPLIFGHLGANWLSAIAILVQAFERLGRVANIDEGSVVPLPTEAAG